MMKNKQIDGFFTAGPFPYVRYVELSKSRDLRVLELSEAKRQEIVDADHGWVKFTLTREQLKEAYGVDMGHDFNTIATPQVLAVHKDMPDDVVYTVTKALAENIDELGKVMKAMRDFDRSKIAISTGIPFHPGAEKYYQEKGLR
jgi:TRAP transporter TAXI family solute receptor